ncbi:MAG TPA: ABC transporter permease, partial [Chlamydiales bacterium]|nr:ABC transporter permease [Chlamydiales bacterium]
MNSNNHQSPPRWINWLLQKLSGSDRLEEIQGDLYELYNYWIQKEGLQVARTRYLFTVLRLIKPFKKRSAKLLSKTELRSGLAGSYLKSSQRSFIKNLSFSLINLSGLTIGFTVCLLIFLFVKHELSYDKFFPSHERIVRIQPTVTLGSREQTWATSEGFLAPALKSYPEVEKFTRILRLEEEMSFTINSQEYKQSGVIAVDDAFFEVFSLPFVYGDRRTALKHPDGVVLSKTAATRLFGNANPIGRIIPLDQRSISFTGVFDDIPSNSHLNFEAVVPLKTIWSDADQSRNMYAFYSYLKLRSPEDIKSLSAKLLSDWRKIYGIENKPITNSFATKLELMPASAIHLTSKA